MNTKTNSYKRSRETDQGMKTTRRALTTSFWSSPSDTKYTFSLPILGGAGLWKSVKRVMPAAANEIAPLASTRWRSSSAISAPAAGAAPYGLPYGSEPGVRRAGFPNRPAGVAWRDGGPCSRASPKYSRVLSTSQMKPPAVHWI